MNSIESAGTVLHTIIKLNRQGEKLQEDILAVEEPLQIQLELNSKNGRIIKNIAVTMRTPGNDEELAAGFLFTEGIIDDANAIDSISPSPLHENEIRIKLKEGIVSNLVNSNRNFYSSSACGVCGKNSIGSIRASKPFVNNAFFNIDRKLILSLPAILLQQQQLFENTGGLHAVALFDLHGNLISIKEDIGRHNALDKVIGTAFLHHQLPLSKHLLLLSGRAGFELIQKAAMAGIGVVAAIGAPSSLAVETAEELGITLTGFLRPDSMNVYTGKQRIK